MKLVPIQDVVDVSIVVRSRNLEVLSPLVGLYDKQKSYLWAPSGNRYTLSFRIETCRIGNWGSQVENNIVISVELVVFPDYI